jgi:2EXR family
MPEMATTETQEALAAFTLFPELPLELQLTIWEYAIPAPQVIPIEVFGYGRSRGWLGLFGRYERDRFRSKVPTSGVLRACKLSRETILKTYNVCIESGSRKIRLDGTKDIVLLYSKPDSRGLMPPLLPWLWRQSGKDKHYDYVRIFSGIKNLAIDRFQNLCWGPIVRAYILSHFESLEIWGTVDLAGIPEELILTCSVVG